MDFRANQRLQGYGRLAWLPFLWLAAVILAVPAVRADIYVWQDEQGVIHFSNQDAPPTASLYLREPEPVAERPAQASAGTAPSAIQEEMHARLERTQRQLERALERVDELTDKIRDHQQEAAVAAAVAQQAAQMSIAAGAQETQDSSYGVRERVVYYAAPFIHNSRRSRGFHHTPPHFKHHKFGHHKLKHHKFGHHKLKHHKWKSHHDKFGRSGRIVHHKLKQRHSIHIHHKPSRLVHHRTRIPKAYGIR